MRQLLTIPSPSRLRLLLSLGLFTIAITWFLKDFQKPTTASKEINERGIEQLQVIIVIIESSEFGQTKRGRIVTTTALEFMKENRILFSSDLADQSMFWRQLFRASTIYIALVRGIDSSFHIPDQTTLAQAVFHETVHSIKETGCLEEECDCFIAAAQAVAALKNEKLAFPVKIAGEPVWSWVTRVYGGKSQSLPNYEPVGETIEWLNSAAGIK